MRNRIYVLRHEDEPTEKEVAERIRYLKLECYLTWDRIHLSQEFTPIPTGTLKRIMDTGKVPKKWRSRLNIRSTAHPRIAISKIDSGRAIRSLLGNVTEEYAAEVAYDLYWIDDGFGNRWERFCNLCQTERQVVRPGKVQCRCELRPD